MAFLKSAAATHLCIGVWRSLYHEALVDLISVMGMSLYFLFVSEWVIEVKIPALNQLINFPQS